MESYSLQSIWLMAAKINQNLYLSLRAHYTNINHYWGGIRCNQRDISTKFPSIKFRNKTTVKYLKKSNTHQWYWECRGTQTVSQVWFQFSWPLKELLSTKVTNAWTAKWTISLYTFLVKNTILTNAIHIYFKQIEQTP